MNNSLNRTTANILKALKKSLFISLGTVALSVGVAQTAKATTLTFDDITTTSSIYTQIPNLNYGGFNFSGSRLSIQKNTPNLRVALGNYSLNLGGGSTTTISSFDGLFDFNSAFFTNVHNAMTIEGYTGGILKYKYTNTEILGAGNSKKFVFDFLGIDTLKINIPLPASSSAIMDNFTFNEPRPNSTSVPEPGLLIGLFTITPSAVAWLKRKKLKQAVE